MCIYLRTKKPQSNRPFAHTETEQGIFSQIRQGMIDFQSNPWPHISKSAKNLIRNMLNPDPAKRFTAHQVLCKVLIFTQIIDSVYGVFLCM